MNKLFRISFIFLLFILTFQFRAYSAETSQKYPNGLLNPQEVYKKSQNLTLKEYPNSNCILVDENTIDSYNPDGTGNSWSDTFIKILTEKGKDENKVQSFQYTLPYSTIKLCIVEVIGTDGKIRKVSIPEQTRTTIDTSQMSSNIYNPNDKILTINIPDLQIGDTIRCFTHEKILKTYIPDTWSNLVLFESIYPIKHMTYTIHAPARLPLKKINILDKIEGTVKFSKVEAVNGTTYKWEINNVPRMFPEPQMPALSSVVQRLLVTTIPSWEFISKWYWSLCKPHLDTTTPNMKAKVASLIKNSKNDIQKITQIFNFVSQKIRYMGLIAEQKSPGFEPHDVKLTFENRYGVCRDKAALLAEMLRIAGYKAYPVLIKVGPKLDREVPLPYFNHAIVGIKLNGKTILMDPTNENTKDIFPAYLNNMSYLIAEPDGDSLEISPITSVEKNLIDINTVGKINKEGILKAKTTLAFHGINDTLYRNFLVRLTHHQQKQLFDEVFRKIIPSSKVDGLEILPKNLQDTNKTLIIKILFSADNEIIKGENNAILSLPWLGKSFGLVNRIIQTAGLEKRKYPLKTKFTCGFKEKLNLHLDDPSLKFISIPKYTPVNTEQISYKQKIGFSKNHLDADCELLLNTVEFSPQEYLKLKKILRTLEINNKKTPILSVTPKSTQTDSIILQDNVSVDVKDNHSWTLTKTIKRKILTYNGKKDFSEIRISYNPVWENVEIENAIVTAPNGNTAKLSKDEINIMDSSSASSAPCYPNDKILVANLPAVEIGSTIEYTIKKQVRKRPFFSLIFIFKDYAPIKSLIYKISIPKNLPLKIKKIKTDKISETTAESANNITYTWTSKNLPPLKKVSSLPPKWTFLPTVMFSGESWKNYSDQLNRKLINAANNHVSVKKITEKILKNKKGLSEKLSTIRNFVAENIRTAGPNFTNMPLKQIVGADTVLKNGYANNASKAVLIYSMLKVANLKPEFTAATTLPYLSDIYQAPAKCPQRAFFSDILIRVKTKNRGYIYLNDTNEYAELGSTSHQNNIGLNLTTGSFYKIEPQKNKADNIKVYYDLSVSNSGNAVLKVKKEYSGNYYAEMKKMFSEMRPEEKSRYYQRKIANISQLAKPASNLYTNFNSYPGIEKYSASIKDYAILDDNYCYFSLPIFLESFIDFEGNKRKLPFFMNQAQNLNINTKINLPAEYGELLIYPISTKLVLPNNSGIINIISSKIKNHEYRIDFDIETKPTILSAPIYRELLNYNRIISNPKLKTFLLEK